MKKDLGRFRIVAKSPTSWIVEEFGITPYHKGKAGEWGAASDLFENFGGMVRLTQVHRPTRQACMDWIDNERALRLAKMERDKLENAFLAANPPMEYPI
jgi:hypothetical protein